LQNSLSAFNLLNAMTIETVNFQYFSGLLRGDLQKEIVGGAFNKEGIKHGMKIFNVRDVFAENQVLWRDFGVWLLD